MQFLVVFLVSVLILVLITDKLSFSATLVLATLATCFYFVGFNLMDVI